MDVRVNSFQLLLFIHFIHSELSLYLSLQFLISVLIFAFCFPLNQSIKLYLPNSISQIIYKKKHGRLPERAIAQQSWPPWDRKTDRHKRI